MIPALYRREILHIRIHSFFDTYKLLFPSVTLKEMAEAFLIRHGIDEEEYSPDTVIAIYERVTKDVIDAQRFETKRQEQQKEAAKKS